MNDLKYLTSYLVPASLVAAIYYQGMWSWATVILVYVLVPITEPLFPNSSVNLSQPDRDKRLRSVAFDWLLYLNVPILYGLLYYFLLTLATTSLGLYEIVGLVFSMGIVIGSCGINVGHELGHRVNKTERLLAKLLLLPAFYMHFYIEHNWGHHKHVATDQDPASAKAGEVLFLFWVRSVLGSYLSAWRIQLSLLSEKKKSFWSISNQMCIFSFVQFLFLSLIYLKFGFLITVLALAAALVGVLLLETINYLEHYGLRRKKLDGNRYERVSPIHSWNANYELGRIMLYELTRHSDHHYLASKKYQLLDHHDESPELPFGYPTAIVIAMIPPLWFYIMNKRLSKINVG